MCRRGAESFPSEGRAQLGHAMPLDFEPGRLCLERNHPNELLATLSELWVVAEEGLEDGALEAVTEDSRVVRSLVGLLECENKFVGHHAEAVLLTIAHRNGLAVVRAVTADGGVGPRARMQLFARILQTARHQEDSGLTALCLEVTGHIVAHERQVDEPLLRVLVQLVKSAGDIPESDGSSDDGVGAVDGLLGAVKRALSGTYLHGEVDLRVSKVALKLVLASLSILPRAVAIIPILSSLCEPEVLAVVKSARAAQDADGAGEYHPFINGGVNVHPAIPRFYVLVVLRLMAAGGGEGTVRGWDALDGALLNAPDSCRATLGERVIGSLQAHDRMMIDGASAMLEIWAGAARGRREPEVAGFHPKVVLVSVLASFSFDPSVAVDMLISNETGGPFLSYLLGVSKALAELGPDGDPPTLANASSGRECLSETVAMVERMSRRGVFPYSAAPLVRRVVSMLQSWDGKGGSPSPPHKRRKSR